MCKVSVIIPLYNKGAYVGRALDSVFAQTFQDYEVIVIDDGSTDNGPEQVTAYADDRLHLIRQANAGPGAARNRGIQEAKGEYVAFLDADDEWLPFFLENSLAILNTHRTCALCTSTYFLGKEKRDISNAFKKSGILEGEWKITNNISNKHLESCLYAVNSCSTVCKKEILIKYGGFYSKDKCTYGEDYYLWLKIVFNCRIYRSLNPSWWYHVENSEIGIREGNLPLHPFMQHPDDIRAECPERNKIVLDRWFSLHALSMAHEYLARNQLDNVEYMMRHFSSMKWIKPFSFLKLLIKLNFPILMKLKGSLGLR